MPIEQVTLLAKRESPAWQRLARTGGRLAQVVAIASLAAHNAAPPALAAAPDSAAAHHGALPGLTPLAPVQGTLCPDMYADPAPSQPPAQSGQRQGHTRPTLEPITVNISSRDAQCHPMETPPATFQFQLRCGDGPPRTTPYTQANQLLGKCASGTATISEIAPNQPTGDSNHQQWQVLGQGTQTVKVGQRPVAVQFRDRFASLSRAGESKFNANYYYASGSYNIAANGLSATIEQSAPAVPGDDPAAHSLTELAVISADGRQIVELGEQVAPAVYHDNRPHTFVSRWVKGQYCSDVANTCGFVPLPNAKHITDGEPVTPGTTANYAIAFSPSLRGWVLSYNHQAFGEFPESLWRGTFTQVNQERLYGEVTSTSPDAPCVQMGNGIPGGEPGAAAFSQIKIIGGRPNPSHPSANTITFSTPTTAWYTIGDSTKNGFSFGGPGAGLAEGCLA